MDRMNRTATRLLIAIAVIGFVAPLLTAQNAAPGAKTLSALKNAPVTYLFPEQVNLPAGKPTAVALHFRVAQGLHINSHTPSDEFLIPTNFSIPEGAGVHLDSASYPAGTLTTLPADPATKVSVYVGEFVIQARITAARGNHLVEGKLRFQACNQNQCMPPKTIPVAIDVIGK
jgi:hypothetical protein